MPDDLQVTPATPAAAPPLAPAPPGVTRTVRGAGDARSVVASSSSDRVSAAAAIFAGRQPEPTAAAEPADKPKESPAPPPTQAAPPPEPAKPERPAAPAAEKPREPDPKLAQRLAMVAEKERRSFERERAATAKLAAQQVEIEKRLSEITQFDELKARAKSDPQAFLRANGLTFQELAEGFIREKSQPIPTAAELRDQLRKELLDEARSEARKELEAMRAKDSDAQKVVYEERLKNQVAQAVASQPDKYIQTIMEGREGEVFDYAKHVFLHGDTPRGYRKGHELALDEAAGVVEAFLRERKAKSLGTHADRLRSFYDSFGKTGTLSVEAGKTLPAQADAGKGAGKPKDGLRGKERDPVGRFSKTVSTGSAQALVADDETAGMSLEELRESLKRKAIKAFGG